MLAISGIQEVLNLKDYQMLEFPSRQAEITSRIIGEIPFCRLFKFTEPGLAGRKACCEIDVNIKRFTREQRPAHAELAVQRRHPFQRLPTRNNRAVDVTHI